MKFVHHVILTSVSKIFLSLDQFVYSNLIRDISIMQIQLNLDYLDLERYDSFE